MGILLVQMNVSHQIWGFSAIISLHILFIPFFLHFIGLIFYICWYTWCSTGPWVFVYFSLFFFPYILKRIPELIYLTDPFFPVQLCRVFPHAYTFGCSATYIRRPLLSTLELVFCIIPPSYAPVPKILIALVSASSNLCLFNSVRVACSIWIHHFLHYCAESTSNHRAKIITGFTLFLYLFKNHSL